MTCFYLLFPMPASTKENSEKLYRQKFHSPIWSSRAKVSARNSVLELKSRHILKCGDIIHIKKITWRLSVIEVFVTQYNFLHFFPTVSCFPSFPTLSLSPSCSTFSCFSPLFTVLCCTSCSRFSGSHLFQLFIIS